MHLNCYYPRVFAAVFHRCLQYRWSLDFETNIDFSTWSQVSETYLQEQLWNLLILASWQGTLGQIQTLLTFLRYNARRYFSFMWYKTVVTFLDQNPLQIFPICTVYVKQQSIFADVPLLCLQRKYLHTWTAWYRHTSTQTFSTNLVNNA